MVVGTPTFFLWTIGVPEGLGHQGIGVGVDPPGGEGGHLAPPHRSHGQLPALQLELLAKDQLHRLGPLARIVQHRLLIVQPAGNKMELDLRHVKTLK